MTSQRPTQDDVTKLAGFSHADVFQVFNYLDIDIPNEPRQRFLASVDELGDHAAGSIIG